MVEENNFHGIPWDTHVQISPYFHGLLGENIMDDEDEMVKSYYDRVGWISWKPTIG